MIKFVWNGIKDDKTLHQAWYSMGGLKHHPEGTITIYGKHYRPLPATPDLNIENNTDTMTDYFENDRIRVEPTNPYYPQVLAAYEAQEAHNARIKTKRTA